MGRKREDSIWEHFENTNEVSKCKYCEAEFKGNPSVTRLRKHLSGVEGGGIKICAKVPKPVQKSLFDPPNQRPRIDSVSSSNEVTKLVSTSVPQQQNHYRSQNGVQGGEMMMQTVVQVTDEDFFDGVDEMVEAMRGHDEINGEPLVTTGVVGNAFERNMDTVWEWLQRDEVSSIGIYGMGGAGKTTLATHIHNKILREAGKFGVVYWITVSQDFGPERLQDLVAKSMHLDFANEDDVKKRAARLSKELSTKRKFVLFLDDLWDHFDVKTAGIPVDLDGCKLIVTTRSLDVCRRLNLGKVVEVKPLCEEEAWELFAETLGHELTLEVEQIARSIVGECDGLPLGVVTMAGSMRGVNDIRQWRNALMELQNSKVRQEDMEHVFRILRFSYARLSDPAQQQCLLYCALYPEDFAIKRDELIEHLIVERIIGRMNSRQATFDKGHAMLNKLQNVSLLECGDDETVMMHDLIRDMAIQIMKESLSSLVESGNGLRRLPEKISWTEDLVRVSLIDNYINEIPSHHSPRCPNLSTLLLSENKGLKWIAEPFFSQLQGLTVLNLSNTAIEGLPKSVVDLKNLTALFLRTCIHLRDVPSLAKLEALEVLDLYECKEVEKVPDGLESLSNLKYLNLEWTRVKQADVLTKLSHLQFLAFHNLSKTLGVKGEEVTLLMELETLKWSFHDHEDFEKCMRSLSETQRERQELNEYMFFVEPTEYLLKKTLQYTRFPRQVWFNNCIVSKEVVVPEHIQLLCFYGGSVVNRRSLCLKNAIGLKNLEIWDCKEMEHLCCLCCLSKTFQTLENVKMFGLQELRDLFDREGDYVLPPFPTPLRTFSHLKSFEIVNCSRMKKLFPLGLLPNLRNLEMLIVQYCDLLEEIIAAEEPSRSHNDNNLSTFTQTQFALPKLWHLKLWSLPFLKSICSAEMICDSLREIVVWNCWELKNIPISLPLQSLQLIEVSPRQWWESVEWGNPCNKIDLQPKVCFHEYQ